MSTPPRSYGLRLAIPPDIPRIRTLIEISVRELQCHDYSKAQLDGALGSALGVDAQLINDETYYLAETTEKQIVGCGGWSKRKTLFGSDRLANRQDAFLDPATEAAKIRAFFVHPAWTRQGIATDILEICEREARAMGFRRFEMGATLTGIAMYAARGYQMAERIEISLPNGELYPVVKMTKTLFL